MDMYRILVLMVPATIAFSGFVGCASATTALPTPNARQAIALTRMAQGTPAALAMGTPMGPNGTPKVARPEMTATSGIGATQGAPTSTPNARRTRIAQRTAAARATKTSVPRPTQPSVKPTPPAEELEPTATPPPLPPPKPLRLQSPEYAVQAFMWYRPEIADRDMDLIKALGFGWVKQQFAWRDIEGAAKGAFDWSHSDEIVYRANLKGLDILARMDNSPDWAAPGCYDPAQAAMGPPRNLKDWTDFLKAFVTRYKGRIRAYQIWNEPNLAREWCKRPPNPEEYAQFLKASYQTIKSIDPNALVISAGMTPTTCCSDGAQALPDMEFLRRLYDAMGNRSDGYLDLLGVHAAGYKAEPEADPGVVAQDPILTNGDPSPVEARRIYCFRHVEDVRRLMQERGDGDKQIAILEFGWTSDPINPAYAWFRVSEEEKADRIVRAFQFAKQNWAPWIGVMSLIYIANPDWSGQEEQYWWAITNPDGTVRPAYHALQAMPK